MPRLLWSSWPWQAELSQPRCPQLLLADSSSAPSCRPRLRPPCFCLVSGSLRRRAGLSPPLTIDPLKGGPARAHAGQRCLTGRSPSQPADGCADGCPCALNARCALNAGDRVRGEETAGGRGTQVRVCALRQPSLPPAPPKSAVIKKA